MAEITKEQIDHIAKLARLRMTDAEEVVMAEELGAILTYVEKLKEVNTDGVEPTAQITGLGNVFRKDEEREQIGAEAADLIAQAPKREGEFVKVKGSIRRKHQ